MWRATAVTVDFAGESGASHHITWSNDKNKDLVDLLQVIAFETEARIEQQTTPPAEPTYPKGRRHPGPRKKE
jgi:hypothetical protein